MGGLGLGGVTGAMGAGVLVVGRPVGEGACADGGCCGRGCGSGRAGCVTVVGGCEDGAVVPDPVSTGCLISKRSELL